MRLMVEIPFAGGVEFFEDVFDEPIFAMHARRPIVLPASFEEQFSIFVFAGDAVVQAAPHGARAKHE